MDELVAATRDQDKKLQYYSGMLDGRPRFGPKIKAVRMNDELAQKAVSQLGQMYKVECELVNGLIRYGTKPK